MNIVVCNRKFHPKLELLCITDRCDKSEGW